MPGARLMLLGESDNPFIPAETQSERYIDWLIAAREPLPGASRPPLTLALVLDCTLATDMLQRATVLRLAREICPQLLPNDRCMILADADILSTLAKDLSPLLSSNCTATQLGRGQADLIEHWQQACGLLEQASNPRAVQHIMMVTDGRSPVGAHRLRAALTRRRPPHRRMISTSTLAIGHQVNEMLLELLAMEHGGTYYYADDTASLISACREEIGRVLWQVAHEVQLTVTVPPGTVVRLLGALPTTAVANRVSVMLGNFSGDERRHCAARVILPPVPLGTAISLHAYLSYTIAGQTQSGMASAAQTFTAADMLLAAGKHDNPDVLRRAHTSEAAVALARVAGPGGEWKIDALRSLPLGDIAQDDATRACFRDMLANTAALNDHLRKRVHYAAYLSRLAREPR